MWKLLFTCGILIKAFFFKLQILITRLKLNASHSQTLMYWFHESDTLLVRPLTYSEKNWKVYTAAGLVTTEIFLDSTKVCLVVAQWWILDNFSKLCKTVFDHHSTSFVFQSMCRMVTGFWISENNSTRWLLIAYWKLL